MMKFLEEEDIMYIKPNMEQALREHMGKYVPSEDRNFFSIGLHYDPLPLYSHFYHSVSYTHLTLPTNREV